MKVSQNVFVPICCFAAVLSMVFVAQIFTGRPSSSGAAVAQPSVPTETAEERESRNAAIERGQTLLRERGLQQGGLSIRYRGTAEGSILCTSPFNLKEAYYAKYDEKWLQSLNCVRARGGLPTIVLDRTSSFGFKLRVNLPNGEGVTVWTEEYPDEYCGDSPCPSSPPSPSPEPGSLSKPLKPDVKRETGTSARWVCQKSTIVNRSGSSP